ncbi:MAG TPA: hypothetical protein VGK38_02340 [Prolixibacteraceae bacterium]|jgi:hypothetical protein
MKKLAILSLIFLLAISADGFQAPSKGKAASRKEMKAKKRELRKLEAKTVNVISKNSFYASFGNVPDVKWRSSPYFDEATFMKDGHEITAFFDFYGTLVGTTTLKTFADIPAKAQKEIQNKYKDYSIGPVILFDDNEFNEMDMVLYNLEFLDEDNYFVEMTKGNAKLILRVDNIGGVHYFKQI